MTQLPEHFLLVNKPVGWTSFDVVNFIRKKMRATTGQKNIKVGHAGTLDPFATGLLIVAVGREATRRIDEFKNLPKTYLTTIHLGATSDTLDSTGTIAANDAKELPKDLVIKVVEQFKGKQLQTPPMYSAKKIGGVRLYKLARQGKEVERWPNEIEIFNIKITEFTWPLLKIEVTCSPGTYIRTLADDIGKKLGAGAYCEELIRTRIGEYDLKNATEIAEIQ